MSDVFERKGRSFADFIKSVDRNDEDKVMTLCFANKDIADEFYEELKKCSVCNLNGLERIGDLCMSFSPGGCGMTMNLLAKNIDAKLMLIAMMEEQSQAVADTIKVFEK
jgi:hypothetical protein